MSLNGDSLPRISMYLNPYLLWIIWVGRMQSHPNAATGNSSSFLSGGTPDNRDCLWVSMRWGLSRMCWKKFHWIYRSICRTAVRLESPILWKRSLAFAMESLLVVSSFAFLSSNHAQHTYNQSIRFHSINSFHHCNQFIEDIFIQQSLNYKRFLVCRSIHSTDSMVDGEMHRWNLSILLWDNSRAKWVWMSWLIDWLISVYIWIVIEAIWWEELDILDVFWGHLDLTLWRRIF